MKGRIKVAIFYTIFSIFYSFTLLSQVTSESEKSPLDILALRARVFQGSDFIIDQTLSNGISYKQLIVSYLSEGFKVYGLLTIPLEPMPKNGFPAVVFVHGYIPPTEYSTIKSYALYQATLAKNGFITFKPDLRGHGRSEGSGNSHFSEVFTVDILEAIASLKKYSLVDPKRIGYWGHSNGGEQGLRILVISHDVKATSLWAGVVGSYVDMLETWNAKIHFMRVPNALTEAYKVPSKNPTFWNTIEPYNFLDFIQSPVQLQHAQGDTSVPVELSRSLEVALKAAGKKVEYFEYKGDNHNINANYTLAWKRTIQFFKDNL